MGKNKRGKAFVTQNGEEAAHTLNGEWIEPSVNPFGHGCCDCGLYHEVEYRVVNSKGVIIPGAIVQMKWSRDFEETIRLRNHRAISALDEIVNP